MRGGERYPSRYAVSGASYNNYKVSKSRYPNLEKVKNRIENMNNDGESWGTKTVFPKIRHKGWTKFRPTTTTTTTTTENGLFETYGDLEGDGDFDDYDSLVSTDIGHNIFLTNFNPPHDVSFSYYLFYFCNFYRTVLGSFSEFL